MCILLVLITYVYHDALFKKRKVSLTVWLPTFRRNVMPSSLRVTESYEIRVKELWFFEYLGSKKQATKRHSLEDLNPYLHSSKHFISCTILVFFYRGADTSLAQPGRKQATTTEDFEFHISSL